MRGVKVHFPIKRGVIFDKVIGYVYAVDGVDLQIRRGETYGLVGESGCGKSTLGKAILNLEPPTEGSVVIDGTDVASLKGEELRQRAQGVPDGLPGPDEQPRPAPVGRVAARSRGCGRTASTPTAPVDARSACASCCRPWACPPPP